MKNHKPDTSKSLPIPVTSANHAAPPPAPDPRAWLEQFPPERRSAIANWFHYAVRSGVPVPAAVLVAVQSTVERRLHWRKDQDAEWLHLVLERLSGERSGAMAYAQSVIEYEALPPEARQRVKAERTFSYVKEAMRGKEVTPAQLAYLRALGYSGAPPADRAHASTIIETLKTRKDAR
jgi:hypothetical protein